MTKTKSMRLCSPFKISKVIVEEVMNESDEFRINYSPNRNSLNKLIEFLKEYSDKRVSICWTDGIDVREAELISKVASNAVHRINGLIDFKKTQNLIKNNVPYYFSEENPACNWLQLEGYAALGVTDVFIADDLTFELKDVRNFCDKHNIRMRLILDRLPASMALSKKVPVYFPQDMDFLSIYYDIGEFAEEDEHRLKVLYETWFKKKEWLGNIQEINPTVPFEFPAQSVPRRFTRFRSMCGQRCLKGGKCNECNIVPELANSLAKHGLRIEVE